MYSTTVPRNAQKAKNQVNAEKNKWLLSTWKYPQLKNLPWCKTLKRYDMGIMPFITNLPHAVYRARGTFFACSFPVARGHIRNKKPRFFVVIRICNEKEI